MPRFHIFTKIDSRIGSGLSRLTWAMSIIAAIAMGSIVLLTTADVCGRYFLNSPIKGTWELVGLLLIFAGTWGLGQCQVKKSHIRITILLERYPKRVQAIFNCVASLIGLAGFSLLCWQLFQMAKAYHALGVKGVSATLSLPFSFFMLIMAISAGVIALVLLVDLLHYLAEVTRK